MAKKTTAPVTENVLYVPVHKEFPLNGFNVLDAMEIGWEVSQPDQFDYLVAVFSNGTKLAAGKIQFYAAEYDKTTKKPNGRWWFKVFLQNDPRLTAAENRVLAKIMKDKTNATAIGTGKSLLNMTNCAFGVI